jgi:hypothetical protein
MCGKAIGVHCCDREFETAAEADAHEAEHLGPAVERGTREILEDIADGTVPASVRSFSRLHDYTDANHYGGAFEADLPADDADPRRDAFFAYWNAVQDRLHQWLQDGRPC